MPVVNVRLRINASPPAAWETVCDIESYPRFMKDVRFVTVVGDRASPVRESTWSVSLRGSILEWTERDSFDRDHLRIDFHQLDGDLERFRGYWQINPVPDDPESSDVVFMADFEIGIPLLADMLNPIAEVSLRDNAVRMLAALETRVTEAVGMAGDREAAQAGRGDP